VTEQNRRAETAQPAGAAQSGQHQTDPAGEPVSQSGPPNDTGTAHASGGEQPEQPFVVRDKRRKPSPRPRSTAGPDDGSAPQSQPDSGGKAGTESGSPAGTSEGAASGDGAAARTGSGGAEGKPGGFAAELEALRSDLDERTRDLQRITAEYANYRRRVERDRRLVAEQATASVLNELLGVLDDVDRARTHGDLVGPFGAVAEQLTSVLAKLGLSPFGEKGDAFDPTRHEAVAHSVSTEVTEPTCVEVFRRGYQYGERLLRPALVAVADPAEEEAAGPGAAEPTPAPAAQGSGDQPGDAASDSSAGKPGEPGGSATATDSGGTKAAGSAAEGTGTPSSGNQPAAAGQSGGHDAGTKGAAGSHNEKSAGDA